ncbi:MAG: DMT family transporter [Methanobacteriota archaeon]|nr:MAG: DMT family transporter [Euryarchaeota archaeon]
MKNGVGFTRKQIGIISLILTTFFWGSTFFLVKETVSIIPLDGFLTVRFLFGGLILLPLNIQKVKFEKRLLGYSILLGTLLYGSFWFQTVGLTMTTPAKAAFITGLNVVFVPFLALLPPFRGRLRPIEIVVAMISLAGLGFLTLDFENLEIYVGDAIIVLTAIAVAFHVLFTEQARDLDPQALVMVQLFVVAFESLIVSIVRGTFWNPLQTLEVDRIVWITLMVTAILATAFAFVSQTYAQKAGVNSAHIAIIFALEPLFALIIDIFRGVMPSPQALLGMALILLANFWIIRLEFRD